MGEAGPETVLELLADEYASESLARTNRRPMSAQELEEECGASERTVYRRLERLESPGLLEQDIEVDLDGHYRTLYETAPKNVVVLGLFQTARKTESSLAVQQWSPSCWCSAW